MNADEDDVLMIEHVRYIRALIDRIDKRLDDLTSHVGQIERTIAGYSAELAELNIRLGREDARIAGLE
jgi:hypothetical protein